MKQNSRIASRNYAGNTQAMSRPSAQSNLFGQKNSQVVQQHPLQTRSQTSMLIAETSKHYLNQPSGDVRQSPKQAKVASSKKGSKTKMVAQIQMQRSEPNSGGISARSAQANNQTQLPQNSSVNYNQKTFYSNYIGANSQKGNNSHAVNSHVSSFVEKSRNNSYSTANMNSTAAQNALRPEMKCSQTQSNLIIGAPGTSTSGLVNSLSQTQPHHQQAVQQHNSMTLSSSRILTNLQDRMLHEGTVSNSKSSKAAAAAVAAARVNANINAAAAQNVQKLAVPDLAQKLLKTQMSLDLKGLSKIAQQQKSRANKAQKSSRAIIPQNKVSIVLNNTNQQWETVSPNNNDLGAGVSAANGNAAKAEYSMRSISRKRDTKGVIKSKIATREASINSVLQDKHLVDDKNETIRNKKAVAQALKNSSNTSAKQRKSGGIQNELLASLNLKSYQKGMIQQQQQQLSAQNSQRAIVSPKQRINNSFKFNNNQYSAANNTSGGVSHAPGAFEGLTPKQTSKAFQRVHNRKTDSKLRASKITSNNNAAGVAAGGPNDTATNNMSYNQYGIAEGGTSNSLSNAVLQGYLGSGAHTGYVTSLGHNSPDLISPLVNGGLAAAANQVGNQSHINFRHSRVQSNVVESFNARAASQSALGLVHQQQVVQHHQAKASANKGRGSMPAAASSSGANKLTTGVSSNSKKIHGAGGPTYQQQIQEKIRQLQMKDQSISSDKQHHHQQQMSGTERNVMSVINQINKRMEFNNQSAMAGQQSSSKKLSSRAAIHKSAQGMLETSSTTMGHPSQQHLSTQKMLQEKLIKKAQEKLGGKSLNQNQIRESKTTKDLGIASQQNSGGSNAVVSALNPANTLGSTVTTHQQNHSMTALTGTLHNNSKRHNNTEKKKKQGDGSVSGADVQVPLGPNGRPLSHIELVGVYKFTRNQQKLRQRHQSHQQQNGQPQQDGVVGAQYESSPKQKEKQSRGGRGGERRSSKQGLAAAASGSTGAQQQRMSRGSNAGGMVGMGIPGGTSSEYSHSTQFAASSSANNKETNVTATHNQLLLQQTQSTNVASQSVVIAANQNQQMQHQQTNSSVNLKNKKSEGGASSSTANNNHPNSQTNKNAGAAGGGSSSSRPESHMRQRMEKAYKQFYDQADMSATAQHQHQALNNTQQVNQSQQIAASLSKISQQNISATQQPKAKGSSKTQQQQKEKSQQMALAAAQREAAHQKQLQMQAEQLIGTGRDAAAGGVQDESSNGETTTTQQQRKQRVGKSASIKRKRQPDPESSNQQAALLQAATRHKFKEDGMSNITSAEMNQTTENEETIGELGVTYPHEIAYNKRKRREASEPPRYYQSIRMQKMFNEADLLVLEDRSNSRVRSFKIFDDKRVFPEIYENEEFQPLDKEEKHDECDYDTEPEHVVKARELMLEDLTESIKFYVEEQPLDLVYNIHKKYK